MFQSTLLFPRTLLFSDAPRRRLFLILIIQFVNLISAQSLQDYYQSGAFYSHSTQSSAEDECTDLGKTLCSSEQLFGVVFQDVEGITHSNLCFNGYTSDGPGPYEYGWFNNDETAAARCSSNWAHETPLKGAHCCSVFEGASFEACSDYACTGTNLPKEEDYLFCAGACDDSACCDDWSEAPLYSTVGAYQFTSLDEAEDACVSYHMDYTVCTYDQLIGVSEAGERICSSGWYKTLDADGSVVGDRGWYVSEAAAADGHCGALAGDRLGKNADGTGSAHCCVASYSNDGYGVLPEQTVEAARQYCSEQSYQSTLCSQAQLQTIAQVENTAICASGWVDDGILGWWQTDDSVPGCGVTGWHGWASPRATAHCCTSYVIPYASNEPVGDYGFMPGGYASSTYTSGALAEAACIESGYDALCSQGQVAWVGTNLVTDLCKVGWAKTAIGSSDYVTPGFYNTENVGGEEEGTGCGQTETWNDLWQPTNPVAHCCLNTVEEIELTQVPYYNGGWGTYTMATMEDAAAQCGDGYQLCSKNQVYQIATIGYDGFVDSNICKHGWTSDGEKGWYQVDADCGVENAWNTLSNPLATWHCCLPFEPTVALAPPAPALLPAFTKAGAGYTLAEVADAEAACLALSSEYTLCSDAQVAEAAINGVVGDGITWESVDPVDNFCYSGFVGSSVCPDSPNEFGWYSVAGGCGARAGSWAQWKPPNGADAWCCANTLVVTADYRDVLGCPETTTAATTTITTTAPPPAGCDCPGFFKYLDGTCGDDCPDGFVTEFETAPNGDTCFLCNMDPTQTTTKEPSTSPTANNPSASPVSYICDYYMIKVSNPDQSDLDFVKDFVGVYTKMDNQFSKFYKPTQYNREYNAATDATLHVTSQTSSVDLPASGSLAVVATSSAGLLSPSGVTVNYFGPTFGSVTVTFECTTKPVLQNYRDVDAAAIASIRLVKMANELAGSTNTIAGSREPSAALADFIDLLTDGHIKQECTSVFANLIDETGAIDSNAMTAFSNGANLNGCAPDGFDIDADMHPTNPMWGRCQGTNVYSNQGALCGVWTVIFGITVNRPNAQTVTGASTVVNIINDFMGYFVGSCLDTYNSNHYGDSLAAAFQNAPKLGSRRRLSEHTDDIYYLALFNNEISVVAQDGVPDGWYPPVVRPHSTECAACAGSEVTTQAYLGAYYVSSVVGDAAAEAGVSAFEAINPSKSPTEDPCPYVVLYQHNGLTQYDGLYEKLSTLNNGRYQFVSAGHGRLLWTGEVWAVDDGNDDVTFTSRLEGEALYPPTIDNWDEVNSNDLSAKQEFQNITVVCDSGETYPIGGGITGLTAAGEWVEVANARNPSDVIQRTSSGQFSFLYQWHNYAYYEVTYTTSPGITCYCDNAVGQIQSEEVTDITVTCQTLTFTVGGSASGIVDQYTAAIELTSDQTSESETLEIAANGDFAFSAALLNGATYSVSVSTSNPEFYECTLGGLTSGTILGRSIDDLNLVCGLQTYSIGGEVSLPSFGTITLNLYKVESDGTLTLFDQIELSDYRGLGGANWVFRNEMPRGYDWQVGIESIEGYDSCTPSRWAEDNLRWDIDWVNVQCSKGDDLCTTPTWFSGLVTSGFPPSIFNNLKLCGEQYYYNDLPTCIGGGEVSEHFCDGESLVCAGILGIKYGSMDRQVTLLKSTVGIQDACLADGETCDIGDSCCSPYSDCYWKNDGLRFVRECSRHDEASATINGNIGVNPTGFTHAACPPTTCTATESYALDPFKSEVLYCLADDGVYYMNGMTTCQTTTDTLTSTYFRDFEFGVDQCEPENLRDFDILLDDNIYVVKGTSEYYMGIVDDAINNCCVAPGSYDSSTSGWEDEINYIDSQASKYSTEIQEKLNDIVSQARDLLSLLQATSSN